MPSPSSPEGPVPVSGRDAEERRPFVPPAIRPAEGPHALLNRRDVLKATGALTGALLGLQSLGLLAQSAPNPPQDPSR